MTREHSPWLDWAVELQALAQAGLAYGRDAFDIERFTRVREIACDMLSYKTGLPQDTVRDLFCNETGYQTPKIDCRAAVFRGDTLLLVRERDGKWSLPGGWVDVHLSVGDCLVKEVREEAGLAVRVSRLVAVLDRDRHNSPRHAYGICKVFALCEETGAPDAFAANAETSARGFFAPDALPPLSLDRVTPGQLDLCRRAAADPAWQPVLD